MNLGLALLLLAAGSKPEGLAERARIAGLEASEVTTFLEALKTGLAHHDRTATCSLLSYPIVASGKRVRGTAA